jgi:phage terminase Nu1 subunit (DNA packaging protein)
VIERRASDGLFDQGVSRLKYLTHLRSEHRRSPRAAADAEHASAKAALLRIRIEEKQRTLVRRTDVDELIDQIAGTVLTHLSGMGARCSRDMVVRRNIDAVVTQIRREISEACSKAADERNEPPLDEQD